MPTYYLRMEGVNLSAVFDDTNQISVIRGASFLLREATKAYKKAYENHPALKNWQVISNGASIGLYSFEAEHIDAAEEVKEILVRALNTDEQFQHFTFVVDIQADTQDFTHDKEALIARNRFRQMQQLSLVIPEKNEKNTAVCTLTNLAPAVKEARIGEELKEISTSVQVRLEHGRKEKQGFYQKERAAIQNNESANSGELDYVESLQEIAFKTGTLKNKIAVLYLDGNKFSAIQREHCQQVSDIQDFDQLMQNNRRDFLNKLHELICNDPDFANYKKMRLETLLWGGDEMLLVVPASKGLKLLSFFYECSKDWAFRDVAPFTHAGGLVFCRAKTPIRRIRKYAQELADFVKSQDRTKNLFDYSVLESIDYPSETPEKLRKKIYSDFLLKDYKPLMPFTKQGLIALSELKNSKNSVSKTQAYKLARASTQSEDEFKKAYARFSIVLNNSEREKSIKQFLEKAFPTQSECWQWIHLVELWDYIDETLTAHAFPECAESC